MPDEITAAIAADLGITDVPAEEQRTIIAQFGEVALKAATISVMKGLAEDKREAFIALAEKGDAAALKEFLDREVPGHEDIVKAAVAEEVRRFKDFQA
ncbi:MAG TPA: DUF5663 domain-containing protein [Candidatus Paceibacterota bacterium]|nr:DUF5663 domain-containing protein [Candidatus Paceibacterota bacterium]